MGNKKGDLHIVDLDLKPRKKSGQRLLATPTHSKAVYLQSQPAGPVKLDTQVHPGPGRLQVAFCQNLSQYLPMLKICIPSLKICVLWFSYSCRLWSRWICCFHGKSTETSPSPVTTSGIRIRCATVRARSPQRRFATWQRRQRRMENAGCLATLNMWRQKPGGFRHGDSNQKHVGNIYGNMGFEFLNSKHVLKWGERKCANLDGWEVKDRTFAVESTQDFSK